MSSIKALRKRLVGVKNTKQLTRAMKMVSAAKLRKAQERVEGARPYMALLENMIAKVSSGEDLNPLSGDQKGCLVFSSDRGLCGGYNANVVKLMVKHIDANPDATYFVFGRKAINAVKRQEQIKCLTFDDFFGKFSWEKAEEAVTQIYSYCHENSIGTLDAIYTRFVSAGVQRLQETLLFPIEPKKIENAEDSAPDFIPWLIEPSKERVFKRLVKHFSEFLFFYVSCEVIASEHGARMAAMDAATRNAEEVIDKLTLKMNRARQADITKELLEIISGKEALEN